MKGSDEQSGEQKSRKTRQRGVFERPQASGVWWVRYVDEHGRLHREKVGPKALALKVYQKRKNEVAERRFFPESIGRRPDLLLKDVIDDYLSREEGRMRSFVNWERNGRLWKAALGGRTLRQIKPEDVERQVAKRLQDGMAHASINRELTFLRRVFNVATENDHFDGRNPVGPKLFFKEDNQRTRYLSNDEEGELREAIGEAEWSKVAFAFHTGFRQANQFRLSWADVNFDTGQIRARKTKSGRDYFVPMNDELRGILSALGSRLRSRWVFPSATGETPLDAKNYMHRVFLPALKVAKIDDFKWHDLRHTFASRLVMAGVDLRTVQELMGHETMAMTERYSHLSPATSWLLCSG